MKMSFEQRWALSKMRTDFIFVSVIIIGIFVFWGYMLLKIEKEMLTQQKMSEAEYIQTALDYYKDKHGSFPVATTSTSIAKEDISREISKDVRSFKVDQEDINYKSTESGSAYLITFDIATGKTEAVFEKVDRN